MTDADKLLYSIADEANASIDFGALKTSILTESKKRDARKRSDFIRYASVAAVFVFVVGAAAIFSSRNSSKDMAAPMMMAASDSCEASSESSYAGGVMSNSALEDGALEGSSPMESASVSTPEGRSPDEAAPDIATGETVCGAGAIDNSALDASSSQDGYILRGEGESVTLDLMGQALVPLDFGTQYAIYSDESMFSLTVLGVTEADFLRFSDSLKAAYSGESHYELDNGRGMFTVDNIDSYLEMSLDSSTLLLTISGK